MQMSLPSIIKYPIQEMQVEQLSTGNTYTLVMGMNEDGLEAVVVEIAGIQRLGIMKTPMRFYLSRGAINALALTEAEAVFKLPVSLSQEWIGVKKSDGIVLSNLEYFKSKMAEHDYQPYSEGGLLFLPDTLQELANMSTFKVVLLDL